MWLVRAWTICLADGTPHRSLVSFSRARRVFITCCPCSLLATCSHAQFRLTFGSVHTKDNQSKYMSNTNHAPPQWCRRRHITPASQGLHGPLWTATMTRPRPRHVPPAPYPVACLPPCRVPLLPPLRATAAGVTCRRHPMTPTCIPLTHLTTCPPTLSIHPPTEFPSHPLACCPHSLLLAPAPTTPQTCRHRPTRTHLPPTTHIAHPHTEPQP